MKHYHVYTAKNGEKYVQTSSKYLAHALNFCRFQFIMFDKDGNKIYSFQYSEELIELIEHMIELRHNGFAINSNKSISCQK